MNRTRFTLWSRAILPLILALSAPSALARPHATAAPASAFNGAALLKEAWTVISERFYDPAFNGADWEAVLSAYTPRAQQASNYQELSKIINAMLAELRVSHTGYYTPLDREYYELVDIFFSRNPALAKQRSGIFRDGVVRYEGIGIVTRQIESETFIIDLVPGLPADDAGLHVGDQIVSANGKPFHPILSFLDKAGQTVLLLIQRTDDQASRRVIEVKPTWIEPHKMFLESIQNGARIIERDDKRIAYVRIRSYASEDYQEALVQLVTAGGKLADADALILDIRGGWGGANPDYLNLFNRNIPVMNYTTRDGNRGVHDRQWRKPVVLLVDGGTRSGKEVLTHGFKKYGIGPVVGSPTAGAVLGAGPTLLSDGSLILCAVTNVTVDGQRLEGKGVQPDIEVLFDLRYADGADPQLDRAIDEAAKLD
ncbi:MAG: S41 family peptidase [Phycisphaerales bacterium]|nr:S41 family peptidase [Phycisphaerales bacterium]MCI0630255.1 S41 family peptidase [Phycisphaerales bacterium]MCI0676104.1 S41 family peptidase [Phycisphaerales bacterium]